MIDRKRTVLILDDDLPSVAGLQMLIVESGLEVVTTSSPFALPFLIRQHAPSLVMIDLSMPSLSGDMILSKFGRQALRTSASIVLFSGRGAQELARLSSDLGLDGFIQKGADLETTLRRIHFWSGGGTKELSEYHLLLMTPAASSPLLTRLRLGGYLVTTRQDLDAAQPFLEAGRVDGIVVDLSTMETLDTLRKLAIDHASTPVLAITRAPRLVASVSPRARGLLASQIESDLITSVDRMMAESQPRFASAEVWPQFAIA